MRRLQWDKMGSMRRAKLLALAGFSAVLVLALRAGTASDEEAVLEEAVSLPVHKDGKRIGETRIPPGAHVAVLQIRNGMALISRAPAEPVWVREESLAFNAGSRLRQSTDETQRATPLQTSESAQENRITDGLADVAAGISAAGRKLSAWLVALETKTGSTGPPAAAGVGEKVAAPAVPVVTGSDTAARTDGTPVLKLWADRERQEPGLAGTYFDQRLGDRTKGDLTLLARGVRRTDEAIDFGPRDWGSRRKMRISGGHQTTWRDFTVQWDGWAELDRSGRLTLLANGGSRMWIDVNGDGKFADSQEELTNNDWGGSRHKALAASAVLQAGVYPVRIQYEGSTGENAVRLGATDGFVDYVDFEGNAHQLFLWLGREVALLTRTADYDPAMMAAIVEWYDKGYEHYARITGRKPWSFYSVGGRNTIAEVPQTCGWGCGMLGATGVEMITKGWEDLFALYREEGAIYGVILYEFGRNFYFYGRQMGYRAPDCADVAAAFALTMKVLCYHDGGLPIPDSVRKYEESISQRLDSYIADKNQRFDNTLCVNKKSGDLLAAMILRLHRDYGGEEFISRFWQSIGRQDEANSTQDAVDNFVRAACLASERNLTGLLAGPWKFPVSDSLRDEMQEKFGLPSS